MVEITQARVKGLARCPRCRSSLREESSKSVCCTSEACAYASAGFPVIEGKPILIDFERSIFERSAFGDGRGSVLKRDDDRLSIRTRLRELISGTNPGATHFSKKMIGLLKDSAPDPILLIIGGGAIGAGTKLLYADPSVEVLGLDAYISHHTDLVADAHFLPLANESCDGVWIQAVLEHVLDPQAVADEIFRVLKPSGYVFADTPFMQQVHEAAYDFTRFTLSGHRWLFRKFDEMESGAVGGPGTALVWSIRYFFRALFGFDPVATALTLPFVWLRFFDRLCRGRNASDAASGVYFLGRKSDSRLSPRDMVTFYERAGCKNVSSRGRPL